jgi:hypothetical protein
MNNGKLYNDNDIAEMKSRFSASRAIFVKTINDDHTLEENMKESLNRIDERAGSDDEQSTTDSENGGDIQSND